MRIAPSITRDIPLKLIAVVLALAIWIIATGEKERSTPVPKFDMVLETSLDLRNVGRDLVVTDAPATVSIHARGPKELQNSVAGSTMAYADLAGRGPGQHVVTVEAILPAGVELVRVEDSRIPVTIERRKTAQYPVEVGVLGVGASPLSSLNVEATPREVTVDGPERAVAKARRIVAVASPGVGQGETVVAPVVPLDDHGEIVAGLLIYPRTVTVRLDVEADPYSRRLPVRPVFSPEGPPASSFTRVSVVPDHVIVCGDPGVLAEVREILTAPVRVDAENPGKPVSVSLDVPAGLICPETEQVRVEVQMAPKEESSAGPSVP
ncbi:MAG: hypothetical protein NUW23_11790 [Firmicutes bacterium]|nr:hypothetical protein [Bacillota bacterium]